MTRLSSGIILGVAITVGLAGCDLHANKAARQARAVSPSMTPPDPNEVENRLYADAIGAIEHRDYATALDELQLARAARPRDPRVFAAMGVVYDKLGRFDLSARYYSEAETLDPGSKVVAIDRAYSEKLRNLHDAAERQVAEVPAAPTVASVTAVRPMVAAPREQVAVSRIVPSKIGPLIQDRLTLTVQMLKAGIVVVNEHGDASGTDAVRRYLAKQGWTLSHLPSGGQSLERRVDNDSRAGPDGARTYLARLDRAQVSRLPPTSSAVESRIIYPTYAPRVARALARSLPFHVALVPCETCSRLKLIVARGAAVGAPRPRTIG